MNFILFNLSISSSSLTEFEIDNILKETAYGAKVGVKKQNMNYSYILLPLVLYSDYDEEFEIQRGNLENIIGQKGLSDNVLYSLFILLKTILLKSTKISIDIIRTDLDTSEIDIFYTDGSYKKDENKASYACCKLVNIINDEGQNTLHDDFTNADYGYIPISGVINESTNNIGELTGIKIASENFDARTYQLIISDSEYSIKSFREWYYVWKDNDFKNYAKKPIKNEQLIKDTFLSLFSKNKIVLFKWTQGHNNNAFNEKCDELAKNALGIEKKK